MIGLGCEVNQIDFLLEAYQIERGPPFRTMTLQDTGGTRKDGRAGDRDHRGDAAARQRDRAAAGSAAELSVALQCGGSDAYSGITANPALGYAPTCWWPRAAPASSPRRPRSMAPSTS
jgi:altronate hydrolase